MCREGTLVTVRLVHNDFPDDLRRQITQKLGDSSVVISELTDGVVELKFDEREDPWKHPGAIGRAIESLMGENEWIRWEETPGSR
ncbi:MAG: hypothetical protein ABIJ85_02215 [bacterium]|nr:hypothetical protein [Patescibacteria group bacterium]